jgi:hypothetical protein
MTPRTDDDLTARVVNTSLRTLPRMLVPGREVFCLELTKEKATGDFAPVFSRRYSIMCLLGLERARRAGLPCDMDLDGLFNAAVQAAPEVTVGDLGLLLWLAVRRESSEADRIARMLEDRMAKTNLDSLPGMEIAWMLTGTAFHESASSKGSSEIRGKLMDYYFHHRVAPAGLSLHCGSGWRRRFPNFATQIYSLHALSICARLFNDERCARQAIRIADILKALQRPNGGWPWLYDASRGIVVEPFEVYSVHQHAMGPMGLWELHEATGYDVREMLRLSMNWLDSNNELSFPMIDDATGLIYRSIRRSQPWSRLAIYSRTARSFAGLRPDDGRSGRVRHLEMNLTCRPYELGWALEAWTGRPTAGLSSGPAS